MHSNRREGYLLIDHRATGQGPHGTPVLVECATETCSHCQRIVILRPERERARNFCPKCDHYICDQCEAVRVLSGYACRPFRAIIDRIHTRLSRGQSIS
jgi:hypothetical protein